jgi:hypothetical protein
VERWRRCAWGEKPQEMGAAAGKGVGGVGQSGGGLALKS